MPLPNPTAPSGIPAPGVVPYIYNDIDLDINQDLISAMSTRVLNAVTDIVHSLETINTTLGALKLGWAGQTAAEVQHFGDRWQYIMAQLFGTVPNPQDGVLNIVATALQTAADNYGNAEDSITKMFSKLAGELTSAGPNSDPTGQDQKPIPAGAVMDDPTVSAVSETNWSALPAPNS
jgi:uncharacterized protein YukE